MRKEVVWAIIAGVTLGLIVAYGLYRINYKNQTKINKVASVSTPTPTPETPNEFKVVLDKPQTNEVSTQNSITVSGVTKATSWIVVSGEDSDYLTQSDSTGAFFQDVDLVSGINRIKVTAMNDSKSTQGSVNTLVMYSSSFQEKPVPTTAANASTSSDLNSKVAQDIANTAQKPIAYIGTVTDITDSTIEIKNASSEIEQVSIDAASTSVVNIKGTNNKQLKTSDIAIGDFIVAMGYVNVSSVLSAQRILITDAITDSKISVATGVLSDDNVVNNRSTSIQSFKNKILVNMRVTQIGKTDKLIYVNVPDDNGKTFTRSIFDISVN